jgi:signal transduction histidine kinase
VKHINDKELLGEISRRLDEYNKTMHDLKIVNKQIEKVNRKLQESEALKGNFLSNIRNEINNPLTSIMGLSHQMMQGEVDPSEIGEVAKCIHKEAFDLEFQLNNIFIAAEIEAGEVGIGVANVEVERFIKGIVGNYAHKIDEKRLDVLVECEGGDSLVFKVDPVKLNTIIVNLLSNAIEYNFEGKKVLLRAWKEDGELIVSVADEGIGISMEEKESIFDRFSQLDSGSGKAHRGHGLGLSVVKSLLNQLGGNIDVSSTAGGGCTFIVSMPEFKGGVGGRVLGSYCSDI